MNQWLDDHLTLTIIIAVLFAFVQYRNFLRHWRIQMATLQQLRTQLALNTNAVADNTAACNAAVSAINAGPQIPDDVVAGLDANTAAIRASIDAVNAALNTPRA